MDVYTGRISFDRLGFLLVWLVDDHPAEAKWLSADEKKQLAFSLQKEQELIKPVKNFGAALGSRTVILLCVQFALWSIGAYGFIMWLPSIIEAAPHMSIVKTGWLSACPYLFAIAGMFTAWYFSDKFLNRKSFIWPFLLVGALAFYFSWLAGAENFRAFLCIACRCRYGDVYALWSILCDDYRNSAQECECRRDRANQ